MSVTPSGRMSEEILAAAIRKHYVNMGLPHGVAIEALEGFSCRMASGLRKIVTKFRAIYHESPTTAKNKTVQQLKQRLQASQVPTEAVQRQAREEDLQQVASPPDWAAVMAAKLLELKKRKETDKDEPVDAAEPSSAKTLLQAAGPSPVEVRKAALPTPARSHVLPKFVVEALQETVPVPPVDMWAKRETEQEDKEEKDKKQSQKGKKKNAQEKRRSAKKGKGKKQEIADAEVERGLGGEAPPQQQSACLTAGASASMGVSGVYEPKVFMQKKKEFIQARRASLKISHREAELQWMHSDDRAQYLESLGVKELKRRRFM